VTLHRFGMNLADQLTAAMKWTSQTAIIGAIVAIAASLPRNNGQYDSISIVLVGAALLLVILAASGLGLAIIEEQGQAVVRWALAGGILVLSFLFFTQPIFSPAMPRWIALSLAATVCSFALPIMLGRLPANNWVAWLLVGTVFAFCAMTVWTHQNFVVDVRLTLHVAAQALFHGNDPYLVRFPNIYLHPYDGADNIDAHGMLKVGFAYPPLVAIFGIPGVLFGDVRWSHVLAMTAAAAAIAFARKSQIAIGAVAMFTLMPLTVYFLAGGWSEPLSIVLLCGTVWAAVRGASKTTGLFAGLLIASKQYFIVIVPLLWLLAPDRRGRWQVIATAILGAVVVTLPLMMWHPAQSFDSVISFHSRHPFRTDSLSFLAAFARSSGLTPPLLVSIGVLIAASLTSTLLAALSPRTPCRFALSVALTTLLLFAFSQQAFGNYYIFTYAALCAALATCSPQAASGTVKAAVKPTGETKRELE
jgi:hypothetical protein